MSSSAECSRDKPPFIIWTEDSTQTPICYFQSMQMENNTNCHFVAFDVGLKCVCRENYRIASIVSGKLQCEACPVGQVRQICSVGSIKYPKWFCKQSCGFNLW